MRAKVDPKQTYTKTDIVRLGLLPWARDQKTVTRVLASGALKTKVAGESTQKRYTVKGKDLINYITTYGPVLMHTVRKANQNNHGKRRRTEAKPGRKTSTRKA